jgi:hypothetical protein
VKENLGNGRFGSLCVVVVVAKLPGRLYKRCPCAPKDRAGLWQKSTALRCLPRRKEADEDQGFRCAAHALRRANHRECRGKEGNYGMKGWKVPGEEREDRIDSLVLHNKTTGRERNEGSGGRGELLFVALVLGLWTERMSERQGER